jgi:hypothetical protein
MQVLSRKLGVALTGLAAAAALAVPMAGQADAATSTVLLHTETTIPKLLTDNASGIVTMEQAPLGGHVNQRWVKTDTSGGYATYTSVSSINAGKPRCLTGRGLQGLPVVTAESCPRGSTKQQWRLGVSGDFSLRGDGLVAGVNAANNKGVLMQFFTGKPTRGGTRTPVELTRFGRPPNGRPGLRNHARN